MIFSLHKFHTSSHVLCFVATMHQGWPLYNLAYTHNPPSYPVSTDLSLKLVVWMEKGILGTNQCTKIQFILFAERLYSRLCFSGVARQGHTEARALATGGCAPPVQVCAWIRVSCANRVRWQHVPDLLNASALCAEFRTNVICPCCALASAMTWLRPCCAFVNPSYWCLADKCPAILSIYTVVCSFDTNVRWQLATNKLCGYDDQS